MKEISNLFDYSEIDHAQINDLKLVLNLASLMTERDNKLISKHNQINSVKTEWLLGIKFSRMSSIISLDIRFLKNQKYTSLFENPILSNIQEFVVETNK